MEVRRSRHGETARRPLTAVIRKTDVTVDDIDGAIAGLFRNDNKVDVTMLITKTSVAGHYHLAVARFYESIAKQMSEKDIANLYHDMMREIKNK